MSATALARFEAYVAAGDIHYFVGGGSRRSASAIETWVAAHFPAQTVGRTTDYDLTPTSTG